MAMAIRQSVTSPLMTHIQSPTTTSTQPPDVQEGNAGFIAYIAISVFTLAVVCSLMVYMVGSAFN